MLTLRRRGKTWHVRGSVRVGRQTVQIAEHSTGSISRAVAESYRARLQSQTEAEILHGAAAARRSISFDEAALRYLDTPRHLSDVSRVRTLTAHFAGVDLGQIDQAAWDDFAGKHLAEASAATRRRIKTVLAAVCQAAGFNLPAIDVPGRARSVIAWLPLDVADRLIDAYPDHVRPIAICAAYCGFRASELLTLKAGDVDLARPPHGAVLVRNPKNGRDRVVPLHPRAREAILPLLAKRQPGDVVFKNRYGQAYTDTRQIGGNPLSSSHRAACARAGVTGFRWHDWRHHFATWALRPVSEGGAGLDVASLQYVGGWSTADQVMRYAHASYEAAAAGIARRA